MQTRISQGFIDIKSLSIVVVLLVMAGLTTSLYAETSYRVRSSDNLTRIIDKFYKDRTVTKEQIMVSILNRNPRAFKNGNINHLLKGRKLILPDENELEIVSQDDALLILADQAMKAEDDQAQSENPLLGINTATRDELADKQDNQSKKISKLEKESQSLRKQLELLMKEKGQRDKKLEELERSMKASLPGGTKTGESNVTSLDEASQIPESKAVLSHGTQNDSELGKRPVEGIGERKQLTQSEVTDKAVTGAGKDSENISKPQSHLTEDNKKLVDKGIDNNSAKEAKSEDSGLTNNLSGNQKSNLSTKLIWLLPVILLGLFWYLFKQLKGSKKNVSVPDEDLNTVTASYRNKNENLVADYKEPSIETNLKLDLAKAYIDIGDTEEANHLLNEVIKEGSEEQKEQAKKILSHIENDLIEDDL